MGACSILDFSTIILLINVTLLAPGRSTEAGDVVEDAEACPSFGRLGPRSRRSLGRVVLGSLRDGTRVSSDRARSPNRKTDRAPLLKSGIGKPRFPKSRRTRRQSSR